MDVVLLHALVEVVGQEVQQSSVSFRQLVHERVNGPHSVLLLVVLCKKREAGEKDAALGEEIDRTRGTKEPHSHSVQSHWQP